MSLQPLRYGPTTAPHARRRPWLVAALLLVPVCRLSAEGGEFVAVEVIPLGGAQAWAAAADLNADGRDDVVFLPLAGDRIELLLSAPGGGIARRAIAGDFDNPLHATTGRADGDPHLDLGVGFREGARLFFGSGDGTFRPGPLLPSIFLGRTVIFARVDGDEHTDVLLGDEQAGAVRVFFGDGEGSFVRGQDFPTELEPHHVAVADLDRDGDLDLVLAMGTTDLIGVALGNGDGSFARAVRTEVGANNRFLSLGDLDHDGLPDVAVSSRASASISTLRSLGGGALDPPVRWDTVTTPEAVEVLDFDGDDRLDLLVTGGGERGALAFHTGDGSGGFDEAGRWEAGRMPINFVVGTFTRAEVADVIIANAGAAHASLLRGVAPGELERPLRVALEGEPVGVLLADVAGDAHADLVVARADRPGLTVLPGGCDATFGEPRQLPATVFPGDILAVDLDRDGRIDLAVTDPLEGVTLWRGTEDWLEASAGVAAGALPVALAAGDIDADGLPDLLVANRASGDVSLLRQELGFVFVSAGAVAAGTQPADVLAADLTGDGAVELIAVNAGSSDVHVLRNDGNGGFSPAATLAAGVTPHAGVLTDTDLDGALDLIVADEGDVSGGASILLFAGLPDAGFAAARPLASAPAPIALLAADFGGSAALDLAVLGARGAVYVHLAGGLDGLDALDAPRAFESDPGALALAAAELSGDGRTDLAVASPSPGALTLLLARNDAPPALFRRGWVNGDEQLDLSDAVSILTHLFLGGELVPCPDAADTNDDGRVDLSDGVSLLNFLFLGGAPPPAPGTSRCGVDPTLDALGDCAITCP